ncbi:hypothetical protein NPIL_118381 [Nephila pilipes]|uniref:Uncharacterized protein n=1 Tax=Nephila pilipes TaxID=299642 RepID=A0A8X6P608_NEPPI|nr:hypothetical protein NPIL_118381 [Nephila pilipes]
MFERLTQIILGLISVTALTLSQSSFELDEENQNHLYPCWTYMNCYAGEGGPEQQKRDECLAFLQDSDFSNGMDNVKKNAYKLENDDLLPLVKEYCAKQDSERRNAFEKVTQGMANYYMLTCSTPGKHEECGRYGDTTECLNAYLDELKTQKKCVIPK